MKIINRIVYALRIARSNIALRRQSRRVARAQRNNPGPKVELVTRRYSLKTGRVNPR